MINITACWTYYQNSRRKTTQCPCRNRCEKLLRGNNEGTQFGVNGLPKRVQGTPTHCHWTTSAATGIRFRWPGRAEPSTTSSPTTPDPRRRSSSSSTTLDVRSGRTPGHNNENENSRSAHYTITRHGLRYQ